MFTLHLLNCQQFNVPKCWFLCVTLFHWQFHIVCHHSAQGRVSSSSTKQSILLSNQDCLQFKVLVLDFRLVNISINYSFTTDDKMEENHIRAVGRNWSQPYSLFLLVTD